MGADTYERSVNQYFHLYSHTYSTDRVSLGKIYDGKHRIRDGYIIVIEQIGWDKDFMIVKQRSGKYYIQDLKKLQGKDADDFSKYLYGPLTKEEFNFKKDSLKLSDDLEFDISY